MKSKQGPTIRRTGDYDPQFVRTLLRDDFGVTDPAVIKRAQHVYDEWYNAPLASIIVNPHAASHEVDLAFVVNVNKRPDVRKKVYVVLNRNTGEMLLRMQRLTPPRLKKMTDLQVANLVLDREYMVNGEGRGSGEYIWSKTNSIYQESAFKHLAYVINQASSDYGDQLQRKLWTAMGYRIDDKRYYTSPSYNAIHRHAEAVARLKIRTVFKEFLAHLEPFALRVLARARLPVAGYYSWLVGQNLDEKSSKFQPVVGLEIQRRRQEAAWAYPLFLPRMYNDQHVARIIEAGGPLIPMAQKFIAEAMDGFSRKNFVVSPEIAKWLIGKKPYLVDKPNTAINPHVYHFAPDIGWLSTLPPEWRPRNYREFDAYKGYYREAGGYIDVVGKPRDEIFRELVAAFNRPHTLPQFMVYPRGEQGRVIDGPPQLKRLFTVTSPVQAMVLVNKAKECIDIKGNVTDFLSRASQQIILPALYACMHKRGVQLADIFNEKGNIDRWLQANPAEDEMTGVIGRRIFRGLSLVKILSLSERWHRAASHLETRTGFLERGINWQALTKPLKTLNGVRIEVLTSTQQLQEMGKRMDNCVGGYSFQCGVASSHVCVLTGPNGSWVSNLEVQEINAYENPLGNRRGVKIIQHELASNDKDNLSQDAKDAADWLVKGINSGEIFIHWDVIDSGREKNRKDAVMVAAGFDPLSPVARDRAYEAWHHTLRDLFPHESRAEYLHQSGIDVLIEEAVQAVIDKAPSPKTT